MPVRKITEQQFRTRRKDRRMVWVDLAALVVGLIVLAASVGAVVIPTPAVQPIEWEYHFVDGPMTERECIGTSGFNEGCKPIDFDPQPEGTTVKILLDPVTLPNVTQVIGHLTWTDDFAPSDPRNGVLYPYDENSTDTLRLELTDPSGTTYTGEDTNDLEFKNGEVLLIINITPLPEGGKMTAFSMGEVHAALAPENTVTTHDAIGEWTASITVLRSGDQEGTAPMYACGDVPPEAVAALPDNARRECDLEDNQNSLERQNLLVDPYERSQRDEGNKWVFDFIVRHYESRVTF